MQKRKRMVMPPNNAWPEALLLIPAIKYAVRKMISVNPEKKPNSTQKFGISICFSGKK